MTNWLNDLSRVAYDKEGWIGLNLGGKDDTIISDTFLKQNSQSINFIREYEINCKDEGNKKMDALLSKYIGDDVIIPFSIEERKKNSP